MLKMIKRRLTNLEYWPYRRQVFRYFGFLEDEYQFKIERDETSDFCIFVATKENCVLRIYATPKETSVTIVPAGIALQKLIEQGYQPKAKDLGIIIKCLDPNLEQPILWKQKSSKVLKMLATYTKRYCRDMLNGDFSQWAEIEDCLGKRDLQRW